ncbi:MAG: sensor histidine kinase [Synechococcaceae cyanobacterium]|nr:sensor histidine kinase [Synechococcaceae cyanobacterium]
MAAHAFAEAGRRRRLAYVAAAIGAAALSLLLLETLLDRRLEQSRLRQLGSEVSGRVLLGEVALERFSPAALAELGGMRLAVGARPEPEASSRQRPADRRLRRQAERLRGEICHRLPRCPVVWPSRSGPRGVWVEMDTALALERVWLFVPLPPRHAWPPDPLLLGLGLAAGSLAGILLYLTLEVQRPLRQLEAALAAVGLEERPAAVPARGNRAVRALTGRFNAMVARLEAASRERATMLAGIGHDLRSPLTRLRLRLALAAEAPMGAAELVRAEADLAALEGITRQFLAFAGAEAAEVPLRLPLEQLLAEAAAGVEPPPELDLPPLERCVRPMALARAVANLLDNACAHGRPPLRLVLRPRAAPGPGEGFEIQVWDHGDGIAADAWSRARQPFQRLDPARGGPGHCGLGLAIAERVARDHGGGLRRLEGPQGFGIALTGHSLPEPAVTSGHSSASAGLGSDASAPEAASR